MAFEQSYCFSTSPSTNILVLKQVLINCSICLTYFEVKSWGCQVSLLNLICMPTYYYSNQGLLMIYIHLKTNIYKSYTNVLEKINWFIENVIFHHCHTKKKIHYFLGLKSIKGIFFCWDGNFFLLSFYLMQLSN